MKDIEMIKILSNGVMLLLQRKEDRDRISLPMGEISIVHQGEVWSGNLHNLGEYCAFAGMSSGYYDFAKPQWWLNQFYQQNEQPPIGVWSYEVAFGGASHGDFVSLSRIAGMCMAIVYSKLGRGEYERFTIQGAKERVLA